MSFGAPFQPWALRTCVPCLMVNLALLGHVIRLPSNRLPRRLLYDELLLGWRPVSQAKLHYSNQIKSVLRRCNIPEDDPKNWQLTENCGVVHASLAWSASKHHPSNKQSAIVMLADALLVWQLQLDLSVLTVAESVHQTSVSAVILIHLRPHNWHYMYISATLTSKLTHYHKPVSKLKHTAKVG